MGSADVIIGGNDKVEEIMANEGQNLPGIGGRREGVVSEYKQVLGVLTHKFDAQLKTVGEAYGRGDYDLADVEARRLIDLGNIRQALQSDEPLAMRLNDSKWCMQRLWDDGLLVPVLEVRPGNSDLSALPAFRGALPHPSRELQQSSEAEYYNGGYVWAFWVGMRKNHGVIRDEWDFRESFRESHPEFPFVLLKGVEDKTRSVPGLLRSRPGQGLVFEDIKFWNFEQVYLTVGWVPIVRR